MLEGELTPKILGKFSLILIYPLVSKVMKWEPNGFAEQEAQRSGLCHYTQVTENQCGFIIYNYNLYNSYVIYN